MANITGTSNNETLTGSADSDSIEGLAGSDSLIGLAGNDTLKGGDGADTLDGGDGNDIGWGENGDDTLRGGAGTDTLRGGAGNDRLEGGGHATGFVYDYADFRDALGPMTIDLAAGTASGGQLGVDVLVGIDGLYDSPYSDTVMGGANGEAFITLGGTDILDGAGGTDWVSYSQSTGPVVVTLRGLLDGTGAGPDGTDVLRNIENAVGSPFADTLLGDELSNWIEGRIGDDSLDGAGGNDTLTGAQGNDSLVGSGGNDSLQGDDGNDSLYGGEGVDSLSGGAGDDLMDGGGQRALYSGTDAFVSTLATADAGNEFDLVAYTSSTAPVTIELGASGTAGTATGASIGNDVLIDIEYVEGGSGNDFIRGSNRAVTEILHGGLGNDTIHGGAGTGQDAGLNLVSYRFASITSGVSVNLLAGTATGGGGNDLLSGISGVLASAFDDSILGSAGADFLSPEGGNDTVDGGAGFDVVNYALPSSIATGALAAGVTVDLATGQASGAQGTDVLLNIEGVRGSEFADVLRGNASANLLQGRAGNDLLQAAGGNDTLAGGTGNDTLEGGSGIDVAAYLGNRSGFDITRTAGGFTVTDRNGSLGTDTLVGIERLHFGDRRLALDLGPTEKSGQVALLLGVLLPSALDQPAIVGALTGLADSGLDTTGIADVLVNAGIVALLAGSNQPMDVARLAGRNVLRTEPPEPIVDLLASFMDGRAANFTPAQFIGTLAGLDINQSAVNLVGLQQSGLAFE